MDWWALEKMGIFQSGMYAQLTCRGRAAQYIDNQFTISVLWTGLDLMAHRVHVHMLRNLRVVLVSLFIEQVNIWYASLHSCMYIRCHDGNPYVCCSWYIQVYSESEDNSEPAAAVPLAGTNERQDSTIHTRMFGVFVYCALVSVAVHASGCACSWHNTWMAICW